MDKFNNSSEKYKLLFEYSNIGMILIDLKTTNLVEVNQSILNSTNYSREELLNLSYLKISPKNSKNQILELLKDLEKNKKFSAREEELIKKNGEYYPISISGFLITDKNNKNLACLEIEDITKLKQHEIIYKDNKQLLEYIAIENNLNEVFKKIIALAEERNPNTMCSILTLDKEKKHLMKTWAPNLPDFYNNAVHGLEIGENIGSCGSAAYKKERVIVDNIDTHENWKNFLELTNKANLHSCWSEPIISSNNEILGTFAIYTNKHKKPTNFEIKLIETYSNLTSKAIEKDIYTKTNKERELELEILNIKAEKLTNSQQVLLSFFDKGDSVLFNWKNDENWTIKYVSQSVTKLFGYSKDDFLSGNISYESCIHNNDKKEVKDALENVISNKFDYFKHNPYRIITKSGEERWVLDYSVSQKDKNGEITNFIGFIVDITEQTKNQELVYHQSKIASMGEMLGNISHQWRQPLSVISSLATGARLKKELDLLPTNEFYKSMDLINKNAQYLSKTIDDFRNFFISDVNSLIEINLKNSIEKVFSLIKDSFKSSNINTIFSIKDVYLISNENIFIQALLNIFNNARDVLIKSDIPEKYVFIDLFRKNDNYILTIKDNAGGIPDNIISKIFEPYFTTKHKSQGTGIGLYMTNQIITKHLKGQITINNVSYYYNDKKYTGAYFEIKVPI